MTASKHCGSGLKNDFVVVANKLLLLENKFIYLFVGLFKKSYKTCQNWNFVRPLQKIKFYFSGLGKSKLTVL